MDDPRLTPARPEVAARYLEGKINAARFTDGEEHEVVEAVAPLQREPAPDAMLETQALRGERVTIYDHSAEGWAWGQLNGDGYVGWIPDAALAKPVSAPTHKVTALRTFAFPGPSIKLPPVETLSIGARITVVRDNGAFAVTDEGRYLRIALTPPLNLRNRNRLIAPIGHELQHALEVAERPEVIDLAGMIEMSRRIGFPVESRLGYDTSAARAAGSAVLDEVQASHRPKSQP